MRWRPARGSGGQDKSRQKRWRFGNWAPNQKAVSTCLFIDKISPQNCRHMTPLAITIATFSHRQHQHENRPIMPAVQSHNPTTKFIAVTSSTTTPQPPRATPSSSLDWIDRCQMPCTLAFESCQADSLFAQSSAQFWWMPTIFFLTVPLALLPIPILSQDRLETGSNSWPCFNS